MLPYSLEGSRSTSSSFLFFDLLLFMKFCPCKQCCGSGSGIRCFFYFFVISRMEKNLEPGSGMFILDLIFENFVKTLSKHGVLTEKISFLTR